MTNLESMKVEELRTIAKEMNIVGAWKLRKADLIEQINANQKVEEEVEMRNEVISEEEAIEQIMNIFDENECSIVNNVEEVEEVEVQQNESSFISYQDFKENLQSQVLMLAAPKPQVQSTTTTKPQKPIKEEKHIILLNEKEEVVKEFQNKKEAFTWCTENHIANIGWLSESLKNNRRMYFSLEGKKTAPTKASKNIGVGYKLQYAS